jgi:hypothetical protein
MTREKTLPLRIAFTQEDAERAHREWGANCGPCALASTLGCSLDDLRPHLGCFESKGFMSPTMMKQAIIAAGYRHYETAYAAPIHGLLRVQWEGPWMKPGVPARVAYGFTHWIAAKLINGESWIFDVNGGWRTRESWDREIAPIIAASIKRADGGWHFTHRWEVRR